MACPLTATLGTGAEMPLLGFGTWQALGGELEAALETALQSGYRHIDTAAFYGNEGDIGKVLEAWIAAGKGTREELFLVTKLPPAAMRPAGVRKSVERSLRALRTDYIDLFLIHVPVAFVERGDEMLPLGDDGEVILDRDSDFVAVWKAMEEEVDKGCVKAIGLSNFTENQIQRVLDNCRIRPANLQVELHVYMQQRPLVAFCNTQGITVTAYSPLGSPGLEKVYAACGLEKVMPDILRNPVVEEVAARLGKSPGQVLLRHTVQRGIAAIPKSTNEARIAQNIQIFDFELSPEDVEKLDALDLGETGRICDLKFAVGLQKHPEYPF
ncbi:aldo-keto reductase family 1 member A1-like isoform X2 [Thrips palmi]|uniref:Aldo-keto reductase family 1 member A1-like isoform X2 n=1 Tax=Thrips palmi TaxID=161013 RepID=A0A6P8ZNH1_THRPL|nr:aldo-keto reductase family 1 member A1-like isoform X2 [Thrips palmi]